MIKNISQYNSDNKFKSTILAYLVHNSTNLKEYELASKLFYSFDSNFDGKIDNEEFIEGLKKYYGNDYQKNNINVKQIFENIDTDDNGYIEHEEFIRASINTKIFNTKEYKQFAFNCFDVDRKGTISIDDIKNKYRGANADSIIEKEIDKLFNDINVDKNKPITKDVFDKIFNNLF